MANVFSLKGRALKLNTAADLEAHIQPLRDNPDIEEIHLEGNTIGVEASAALAKILETKHNLRYANLADIFTGRLLAEIPQALDSLLTALLKCEKLHTINLNDNAFGLNTVEPLRPFLSQHVPLQHLYLNNNGLGPAAGTLVAESLAQLAEKKEQARKAGKDVPHLETVVCGRNRLETGSMAAWVKAYTANKHVKTVKMVQNGIRQEGIAMLLQQGLSACQELRILDLQVQSNNNADRGQEKSTDVDVGQHIYLLRLQNPRHHPPQMARPPRPRCRRLSPRRTWWTTPRRSPCARHQYQNRSSTAAIQ